MPWQNSSILRECDMATYANVLIKTPLGVKAEYTYKVDSDLEDKIKFGERAEVLFRGKKTVALVVGISQEEPSFETKSILRILDDNPIITPELYSLAEWVSSYYVSSFSEVLYSLISFKNAKFSRVYEFKDSVQQENITLTQEQDNAIRRIRTSMDERKTESYYLWGVTGSGKTEVYFAAMEKMISQNKSVIYLVPEIGLTHQLIEKLTARFDKTRIAVLHSALTDSQRLGEWKRIISGEVDIVIGARSAVFAPLSNLGLIIMDEEHDSSYKSDSFVRYHARTIAYKRCQTNNAFIILGSATPSIECYKAFKENKLCLLRLTKRACPMARESEIEIVSAFRSATVISPRLMDALKETLDEKKQAILFLNKRGFLHRLECPECGWIAMCPHCAVPLTYHKNTNKLICHHCHSEYPAIKYCKNCYAETTTFRSYGTELVEEEVKALFPYARVSRLDRDVTSKGKNVFETISRDFYDKKTDILIGTQMVAKGLNFPNVSLVGVINAMSGYTMSDFRADEKLFDLIEQVAGRGGRFLEKSKVIVQTDDISSAPLLAVKNRDINGFLDNVSAMRQTLSLPPFVHFARIVLRSKKEEKANDAISKIKTYIMDLYQNMQNTNNDKIPQMNIVAYGKCSIEKLNDEYRYHLVLSSKKVKLLSFLISETIKNLTPIYGVRLESDIDPDDLL